MNRNVKKINDAEKELLVELVHQYKNIIECKKTDSISNKNKNETWEKLTKEFNCKRTGLEKTSKQLRTSYMNLKGNLRQSLSKNKREIFQTGGGVPDFKLNDNDTLISLLGRSVKPHNNKFDSNADYESTHEKVSIQCFKKYVL